MMAKIIIIESHIAAYLVNKPNKKHIPPIISNNITKNANTSGAGIASVLNISAVPCSANALFIPANRNSAARTNLSGMLEYSPNL